MPCRKDVHLNPTVIFGVALKATSYTGKEVLNINPSNKCINAPCSIIPSSHLMRKRFLDHVKSYKLSMKGLSEKGRAALDNNSRSFKSSNLGVSSPLTTTDNGACILLEGLQK